MEHVEFATGIISTGFVAGIFWRMGGFQAALRSLEVRLESLERKLGHDK